MLTWIAKKLFGTSNDRSLRRIQPKVQRINALEASISKLSDAELKAKTPEFKQKLANGASLDDILVEAFAVCREAGKRVLGMRHYDVQLIGGMVLHNGAIAEMKTGEGKTLVATLPCYLNALEGKGVHVVTVNDYLARRDSEWMARLHNWLGLEVGVVVGGQSEREKLRAYKADITYGQNNEFGFDYLRDNMKFSALDYAQRPLNFAIVDEVDSILIDEARTPLIISGPADAASEKYRTFNELISKLVKDEHYTVDEKGFSASLTEEGVEALERLTGVANLYAPEAVQSLHIIGQLLRAHALYKRDQHYVVQNGEVLIVDEFTGRILKGRRWSDGLHQAVEAKENVNIQEESRTMATITFQNLFRIYKKLGGMTGTATTEAQEFMSTYKLDVVQIPTNRNNIREDAHDVVYKTEHEKFEAVIKELLEENERGRPVLVGTTSVEKSAAIARKLARLKVPHAVLNAKHHENEAFIVAQAGRKKAITVSTNMAGRGTDILLGGNPEMIAKAEFLKAGRDPEGEPEAFAELVEHHKSECKKEHEEVKALGGLHIIGTERHESRRIDNQLRGRAGRQGDPGSSRFYLSLEDDLMRIFGGERVKLLMDRMGMPDDEPIEHPWVTKSVENAQTKVEERNFDIRKHVLEYDDVMNAQRKSVYSVRQSLLIGRYSPDELDELGKPTGRKRKIEPPEIVLDAVTVPVSQLIGMFASPQVIAHDDDGKPRALEAEELEKIERLEELDQLRREIYELFGVVVDVARLETLSPTDAHDEVLGLVEQGLAEQRERLLDLIDSVISTMVEEACPENKQPEDWDWKELAAGAREALRIELTEELTAIGDRERLVRELYTLAEARYLEKEASIGVQNAIRVFRHIYLVTMDEAWVDHLQGMEHLREGIGLRGYGQKDPKNEYKKEGFNLFVTMMAEVSAKVLEKFFASEVRSEDDIAQLEAADLDRHQADLDAAIARHVGEVAPELAEMQAALEQLQLAVARAQGHLPPLEDAFPMAAPPPAPEPVVTHEMECPCGSGKPFKDCHGAVDEDEARA